MVSITESRSKVLACVLEWAKCSWNFDTSIVLAKYLAWTGTACGVVAAVLDHRRGRMRRAQSLTRDISRTGCSECCERGGAHNPSLSRSLQAQCLKCKNAVVLQYSRAEMERTGFNCKRCPRLAFLLVCYVPLARRGGHFCLLEPHTKPRRGTRVKIINRCGVASLRQSNRCGSPTICKQAARRRLSAARRGEQQSAKNDHAAAARPRPRRRQPPGVDDGQRKGQT